MLTMLKLADIREKVTLRLKTILEGVEGVLVPENQWVRRETGQPNDPGIDLRLRLAGLSAKNWELHIEVKGSGHPKQASQAIFSLKRAAEQVLPGRKIYGVFAAPYISPESAKLCLEQGVGYLDLSGNCHLAFGTVHIHVEGKPNQYKPKREQGSLFSPKASRVLRVLLQGPLKPWKVVDLEEASSTSLGTVSTVRKELLKELWADDSDRGLKITKPDAVLDAWAKADSWKRRTTVSEYSLLIHDQDEVARKLHQLVEAQEHAFTQWYGALLRRPHTTTDIITLYVEAFPEEHFIKGELLGRRVESGGTLRLVEPKDRGVFIGMQHMEGLPVVSDIQLYLDLIDAGMRGDEAARELRNWAEFSGGWHV